MLNFDEPRPFQFISEATTILTGVTARIEVGLLGTLVELEVENFWVAHDQTGSNNGTATLLVEGVRLSTFPRMQSTRSFMMGDPVRQLPIGLRIPSASFVAVDVLNSTVGTMVAVVHLWGHYVLPSFALRSA